MTLYELTQDVLALQSLLEDGEIDEQVFRDTVDGMGVDVKIENICKMMKNLEAKAAAYKEEIDRMNARKKTLENGVQRLKDSLMTHMLAVNAKKVEAGLFTVSLGTSKAVTVWDETMLPEEYLEPQPAKVLKSEIAKALKNGADVPGAELVENRHVTIR